MGKSLFSFKNNRKGLDWFHVVFDVSVIPLNCCLCIQCKQISDIEASENFMDKLLFENHTQRI